MVPLGSSLRGNVERRVAQAYTRATALGSRVLLRLHTRLILRDPWLHLASIDLDRQTYFAWHDGRSDHRFAALGPSVVTVDTNPGGRFTDASNHCSLLLEQTMDVGLGVEDSVPDDVPLLTGGFSFTDAAPEGPWQGWPAARLMVPEALVFRRKRYCGLVLTVSIRADGSPAQDVERISQRLTRLLVPPEPVSLSSAAAFDRIADESCAHWCERVFATTGAISCRSFDKVVLARSVRFTAPPQQRFDVLSTLFALVQRHPDAKVFAIGPGATASTPAKALGSFLGASPEVLVEVSGRRVRTVSLAGTAPRGKTASEDEAIGHHLRSNEKDTTEQRLVTENIVERLSPLCGGLDVPQAPQLARLSGLQHLETQIIGELFRPGGILDLVERLHPTPAVGGLPYAESAAWLAREEELDRGWYAAPIGWLTAAGDGTFAVGIRSGLVTPEVAHAFVGAGIVEGSDPRAEWDETELKLQALGECLALRRGNA